MERLIPSPVTDTEGRERCEDPASSAAAQLRAPQQTHQTHHSQQSQHSEIAKTLMNNRVAASTMATPHAPNVPPTIERDFAGPQLPQPAYQTRLAPPPNAMNAMSLALRGAEAGSNGIPETGGRPPGDTPPLGSAPSTAPSSPRIPPVRQNSGTATPRIRPPATTLNIPGMTRSKVSPDGKISQRDVGAKLVVIMVGLPARGKSYITKKIQRYLSWQQHETRIFNVGNRRRVAAGAATGPVGQTEPLSSPKKAARAPVTGSIDGPTQAAHLLLNGFVPKPLDTATQEEDEQEPEDEPLEKLPSIDGLDQSARFFDPLNRKAAQIREQVAMSTLDELLDFLLDHGGSVGILDATNSTIERRQILFNHIKRREPKLGILFVESVCEDDKLLEANMRLKLRGPDYKDKDPEKSYEDFKQRVTAYESAYIPLGKYEEDKNMQYIKMIDVGRKVIHHQLSGFLTGGIASYLSTFNLSPRQIWITRHGKSEDNRLGKLGGDSDLTEDGRNFGTVLYNFISTKRKEWEVDQKQRAFETNSLPPKPGDHTPPYPELLGDLDSKNFCVWTSMLKRSIQTAEAFDGDEDYDVKNWEMLNELNAGSFEGLTYAEIAEKYPDEYQKRAKDKLHYIYPGVGGEGYLQVISRVRDMVREMERIKDHVLVIGHRSIARVLMAYFMDLTRDDIADLDVPLGMLFVIEPKPYGIDFHAYKYNEETYWFDEQYGYKPRKEVEKGN